MPIVRIIYAGRAKNPELLGKLRVNLQEIIATALSTSDVRLDNESVELIFEEGHRLNRGKDLKILVDGNDFPERTENIQERCDKIVKRIGNLMPLSGFGDAGFVYITLQAGGLGKFKF